MSDPALRAELRVHDAAANAPSLAPFTRDPARLAQLHHNIQQALDELARRANVRGEVRFALVDDAAMTRAHAAALNINETTDVLTFDLRDDPANPDAPIDADALLCVDEAARQAAQRTHDTDRELLLYALHAALHCAGHDDTAPASSARMHAAEDDILRAAGFGPLFEPGAAPPTE